MLTEAQFKAGRLGIVGNINRDIKTAPIAAGEGLLRDGETPIHAILETIGGGGANSAFTAAALGAKVAFFGKVGMDALGATLERTLTQHGIESHLVHDPLVATGSSIALAYANGQRHFLSCQPNNQSLSIEDLDLKALDGFTHLLRADIWFSQAMLFGGNARLFQAAREKGLTISIDLNWDPQWGIASSDMIRERKQAVRAVLPYVSLAHGNVRELRAFTDSESLETALKRLEEWGVEAVIVHLGAAGAGYYRQSQLQVQPAVKPPRHLNATGTGDVLSVCMMLLHDYPDIAAKLHLANTIVAQFIAGNRQFIPALR